MTKIFSDKPQKGKQKFHKRGFSEDVQDKRKARINFKNYVRQLEEDTLEEDFDLLDQEDTTEDEE